MELADRTRTEEVAMSVPDNGSNGKAGVKTLAIRLEPEVHAQLSLIAQLRGNTITDEIKAALEAHIASVKDAPELAARAGSVLEDIERDALARRNAIATLFGEQPAETDVATATPAEPDSPPTTADTTTSPRERPRRTGGAAGKAS